MGDKHEYEYSMDSLNEIEEDIYDLINELDIDFENGTTIKIIVEIVEPEEE